MSELDYREVAKEIDEDRPDGFSVSAIHVNFEIMDLDIQDRVRERVCDRLKDTATYYLNDDLEIVQDSSIDDKWTYDIVHQCGTEPMFDAKNDEYYCPICKDEQSVFDY
ncbi:hypothetical protein [Halorubrum salinum]|uniref:hypothetical protein n=1 Tax=Halorubrum salinum TaxID=767517 RepID=UPI0021115477|nr:hypothetical protein [Halorubrum salinum]